MSLSGAISVVDYTAIMGAVAATVAALTGVGGVIFAASVWWKNRGRDGLKHWIHETSGAAEVARTTAIGLEGVRLELSKVTEHAEERFAVLEGKHNELEVMQDRRHTENQLALSGVNGAQVRTETELRSFVDEHVVEALQRDEAIARLSATQADIARTLKDVAEMAQAGAAHARSRKKHPSHATA